MPDTAAATEKPVSVSAGPVATFAESVWLYRRWFIFIALLLSFVSISAAIYYRADWRVSVALVWLIGVLAVLYVLSPSAEQVLTGITKLAALKIPGVSLLQTSSATSGGATATATAAAGPGAAARPTNQTPVGGDGT